MSTNELVWYVAKHYNEKVYLVAEVEGKTGTVMWTTRRAQAMQFLTEEGVNNFKKKYMNARPDVFLINGPTEED